MNQEEQRTDPPTSGLSSMEASLSDRNPPAKPSRILYRIIVPFTLLFSLTTVVSWLLSSVFISHHTEETLKCQMEQVAALLSQSGFALRMEILQHLKKVLNSEIIVYRFDGEVIVSTFGPEANADIRPEIILDRTTTHSLPAVREIHTGGTPYKAVFQPIEIPSQGNVILSIWTRTTETDDLKNTLIQGLGIICLAGIAAMACIGYFIARTITTPVEELVRVTRSANRHGRLQKATIQTRDEIGALAASFNAMVEKLGEAEDRLVESERLATAGQMAAGLAHEIRNPLTSIKMLAQVLQSRMKDDPENYRVLSSLVGETDRLDRIFQEIIDRTRPGELSLEEVDVIQLVEDVANLARQSLSNQGVTINVQSPGALPRLRLDPGKIKQVLWNLILNGRDAMPKGGELTISTGMLENGDIRIDVRDMGPGFPERSAEKLFQPFFTTKPEGMGLGLTISRKIVEKHGGQLLLENHPEGGAWVKMILPVSSPADS